MFQITDLKFFSYYIIYELLILKFIHFTNYLFKKLFIARIPHQCNSEKELRFHQPC